MEFKKDFEILPFGEAAILVNFEQRIDERINSAVIELAQTIDSNNWIGVEYVQPAYCSLLVGFDREKTNYSELRKLVNNCLANRSLLENKVSTKLWNIPVCYDEEFALDLTELSNQLHIEKEELVQEHVSRIYRVYMMGFLPGFPYLGILSEKLNSNRKEVPRKTVPAGSVGLAGRQTGIYPVDAPGGWQIIGKTPVKIFDSYRSNPFLFSTGDEVQFFQVSKSEYKSITAKVEKGTFDYPSLYA